MDEFDRTHRIFVSYIDKSREYYLARGHANPYRWAHHDSAPFAPLAKPLSQRRVGLFTTATLNSAMRGSKEVHAAPADPPPAALHTDHLSWHKLATHTRDAESFLPLRRVAEFADAGRTGSPSPRSYGIPTDFSQRRTIDEYSPAVLGRCRADADDVALLFPR